MHAEPKKIAVNANGVHIRYRYLIIFIRILKTAEILNIFTGKLPKLKMNIIIRCNNRSVPLVGINNSFRIVSKIPGIILPYK
jgi:hypothetical protein